MTSLKAHELFTPPCQLVDQTDLPRVGFRGAQSAEYLSARGFTLPAAPNQATPASGRQLGGAPVADRIPVVG